MQSWSFHLTWLRVRSSATKDTARCVSDSTRFTTACKHGFCADKQNKAYLSCFKYAFEKSLTMAQNNWHMVQELPRGAVVTPLRSLIIRRVQPNRTANPRITDSIIQFWSCLAFHRPELSTVGCSFSETGFHIFANSNHSQASRICDVQRNSSVKVGAGCLWECVQSEKIRPITRRSFVLFWLDSVEI